MSQKKKKEEGTFSRYLKWTILLALVFSAGLIAGHRLLKTEAVPPLVALSMTRQGPIEVTSVRERAEVMKPEFSFYNRLSGGSVQEAEIPRGPAERVVRAPGMKLAERTVSEPLEITVSPVAAEVIELPVIEVIEEAAVVEMAEKPEKVEPEPEVIVEPVLVQAPIHPVEVIAAELDSEVPAVAEDTETVQVGEVKVPRFTLQAGTHTSRAAATRELERYRAQGLDSHLITVEVNDEKFYRVRIGRFADTEEVNVFRASLEAEKGLSTIVVPL